jgi:hypothetical protein
MAGSRSWTPIDWRFVIDTVGLTPEEAGAYARLLAHVAYQGGTATLTRQQRFRITGVGSRRWPKVWPMIADLFEEDGDALTMRMQPPERHPISAMVREAILERDGHRCAYCGTDKGPFQIDHVIPVARAGSCSPGNLAVACVPCNRAKGAEHPKTWGGRS